MTSKYKNVKSEAPDGKVFDSQHERKKYEKLLLLQNAGVISNLRTQVKYTLIPAQRDKQTGKLLERECSYIADFAYWRNGSEVVSDAKGFKTPVYRLKRKLMLSVHGIRIVEV